MDGDDVCYLDQDKNWGTENARLENAGR